MTGTDSSGSLVSPVTDFTDIDGILFQFQQDSAHPWAADRLNGIYSADLPNFERIFTNPTAKDEVLADTQLMNILRQIIREDLIATHATTTADPTDIGAKINPAALQVSCGTGFPPRRITKNTLTRCFKYAIRNSLTDHLVIWAGTSHIFFREGMSGKDWSDADMSTTIPFVVAPPPAAPAAAPAAAAPT